jgi:predicted amidohydrolase YtcJ
MMLRFCLILLGWQSIVTSCVMGAPEGPADTVMLRGRIVTLNQNEAIVSAMAIRDGRIIATGEESEVQKLRGPKTEVMDLNGRMVLPGFIETHCHSIGAARDAVNNTYVELRSIAEMQEWIRERAKSLPPGSWIEVPRNEITRLKEHRHPTPEELDAATTEHPVVYTSVMKHVLNSVGFRAIGVVDGKSTIPDGEVVLDDKGNPALIRGGNVTVRRFLPPPIVPEDKLLESIKKLHAIYNSVGITSICERATDRDGMKTFQKLRDSGDLTVRVTGTYRFSAKTAEAVEKTVANFGFTPGEGDDWVKAGALKITVDGGIHWGTTWLSEPHGPKRTAFYRNADPNYGGQRNYTPEEMRTVFATANKLGWQMSTHVTGDGGMEAVLDAVAAVAKEQPNFRDRRFTLIHAYFPSSSTLEKAKALGVGVDTQSYLYYRDADILAEVYGQPWADRFIGLGDWVRAGVPVAVNSDHMIGVDPDHAMNSFNPFLMMQLAVTRKTDSGAVHGAHQKLSRLDALRTVTQWAAWLSFDEKKLGTLEPGKLADCVVIDRDYLDCPEAEIRSIRALKTIVGGKVVHEAEGD